MRFFPPHRVGPVNRGVALTACVLQPGAVQNPDCAARVLDQFGFLQEADAFVDAGSAHPQHVPQEFLRQANGV